MRERLIIFSRSKETFSVLIPNSLESLIKLYTSAVLSRALVGIQPQFKQTPPRCSASTNAVDKPNCEDLIAATYPPGPPPKIIKSYFLFVKTFPDLINLKQHP